MQTLTRYASERLQLLERLRQQAAGASLAELFRPDPNALRFTLGTSLAELRVPFRITAGLQQIVQTASAEAFFAAAQRHKTEILADEYDQLVLVEGFDPTLIRPLSFQPPPGVTSARLKESFAEITESHHGLDAGVVESVLAVGRAGRRLLVALHSVLTRARREARANDAGEPTAFLSALMLRSVAHQSFALTGGAPVSEPMRRFLRSTAAVLVGGVVRLALKEGGLWRDAGLSPGGHSAAPAPSDPVTREGLLSLAALGQLAFMGPRPVVQRSGVAAWGVAFDRLSFVEEAATALEGGQDPELLAQDLAGRALRDKETQRQMERAGALGVLRGRLKELARLWEGQRAPALQVPDGGLEGLVIGRDALERLLASEWRRQAAAKSAREAARAVSNDEARAHLELFARALKEYRDDEPAAWLGASDARLAAARASVALAADVVLERLSSQAAQLLLERTGTETRSGEQGEYETGRLYLVGSENRPILKSRVRARQVGHLFADVKDFTRRTAFLKENVIADFLQREFYAPILAAASGEIPGDSAPKGRVGIELNNLLGDAVSFSGDIVELVRLSHDIRKALSDYAKRLEAEGSQQDVTARVKSLEARLSQQRAEMERREAALLAQARALAPGQREGLLARAKGLREELLRQTKLFEAERSRAAGEKLEAGSFVSFGAAPVIARFQDPVFGDIKVAIAEKINESARGTARQAAVRERVHAAWTRARRATGRPLELPFFVHVESPGALALPAQEAARLDDLLARGDESGAQALWLELARQRLDGSGPGEVYNAGAALSEEALRAYLEARADELVALERTLGLSEMHPSLRDRFYFPRGKLELVGAVRPGTGALVELFVFQGRALFRGFEATAGLGIFEIVDPTNPLFRALAAQHVPQWVEQMRQAKGS